MDKSSGSTRSRILEEALASFGRQGYGATSLDSLASGLGLRKQSLLYWFPSKEALLGAVIDDVAGQLMASLDASLSRAGSGWDRVEAVVRSAFAMAARKPQLLAMLQEVSRLGPPPAARLTASLEPLVSRASSYLAGEMAAGRMAEHEPRLLLLTVYSAVIGVATESGALPVFGEAATARSLVRRRSELLSLLEAALWRG